MRICDQCFREIPEGEPSCLCNAEDQVSVKLNRRIGTGLAIGILSFPFIFSFFTLREGYSGTQRFFAFWWVWLTAISIAFDPDGTQTVDGVGASTQIGANSLDSGVTATQQQSPYITFDDNTVADMLVSNKTQSELVRLEILMNTLAQVTRFANMDFKSKGRDEVRKYQALLDNSDSYDTSFIGIEGATIRRDFPSGLEFYCRDKRIISPATDLTECQFTRDIAGLSVLLRDPITVDIPCVIEGFDKGTPYCRHQSLRDWSERDEIENVFYRLDVDLESAAELFEGDLILARLKYYGKLGFDPDYQTTQVTPLEEEYLSLVSGTNCFSDVAPNNNRWSNTEYYEEVLNDDWFRDSDFRCGYWVKK